MRIEKDKTRNKTIFRIPFYLWSYLLGARKTRVCAICYALIFTQEKREGDKTRDQFQNTNLRPRLTYDRRKRCDQGGCFTKMLSALRVVLKVKIYKI